MKSALFEIEFFYAGQEPEHITLLHLLEETVAEARKAGAVVLLSTFNCDDPLAEWPERAIALPCLRRLRPFPERMIIARLRSREEIVDALGLPELGDSRPIGLDVFCGFPGAESRRSERRVSHS